ncbi:hypothetical protein EX895_001460 [Sporisorium graminicola]|uniref:JmjC domain-containing protein n=1 Tax=Sporisorium graminicola TaxID=280036 RepID=A0A4U7KXV6_9BASI|nr:hypothetical protein EX895_001460 [Sporisorium graminicola]TKY89675.1 hypothetical protein EX895_001460 [Sporisorium graminicola]
MTRLDHVPPRPAEKSADAKLRRKIKIDSHYPSASSAASSSSSPPPSDVTYVSSSASGSAATSPPPPRELSTNKHSPRHRAVIPDSSSDSMSLDASLHEQEKKRSTGPIGRESANSDNRHKQKVKRTSKIAESKASPSKPVVPAVIAAAASTPLRSTSKRSAAQAAQNNIQLSYSDFAPDEETAPVQKKMRPSTSPRSTTSSPSKPDRRGRDAYRAPCSTAKRELKGVFIGSSSSQALKKRRRFLDDQGLVWELQSESCNTARHHKWQKCVQCISKTKGDTCRFVNFRAFLVDPSTEELYPAAQTTTVRPAFISSPDLDEIMHLPSDRRLAASELSLAQANVARSLLPVLEAELQHAKHAKILRRPRETTCRQMCEFCATSIFSASWFCQRCGREYCPDCKHAIELPDDSDPVLAKRMAQCDRRVLRGHTVDDLVPLTRFDVTLLEQEIGAMRDKLVADKAKQGTEAEQVSALVSDPAATRITSSEEEKEVIAAVKWEEIPKHRAGLTADDIIGSMPLRSFEAASFDIDDFRREWANGEPLLIRNVTTSMKNAWGPEELAARYGDESCFVVRSDTDPDQQQQVSVGEFFSTFGQDRDTKEEVLGKGSWKLKDWPPSAEFKHELPELYEDFNRAVPAPEYTTREGILNLGSCYPAGVIQPDLGPKMYNAWPSSEANGGHGTTRLHMDIADAVNIMLYAAPPTGDDVADEHRPGVAVWDIFRAEDAETLRAFLREKHAKLKLQDDPIHIQRFFITAPQRVELYRKHGVQSWRIYQKAGEAVFIPAGCAHQVCNLTDCVKVAVDFVSPQNVERCFKLTAEFRELLKDYKKAWKEDVLSLRTTLWYAWCTYREMDEKGPNVWAKEQAEAKKDQGEDCRITKKILQEA